MIPDSTPALDDAAAARRKAFVDAARELFFANGYAGTTMSSIASKVGGSKTTLWTYFPSMEDLFAAVVDDIVAQYGDALAIDLPIDARSEERRVGKECVRTSRSGWSPHNEIKKTECIKNFVKKK